MSQKRRQFDRHLFQKEVILTFSDDSEFRGVTKDISLSGLFIASTASTQGIEPGHKGELRLTADDDENVFPFAVIRAFPDGLAIQLDKDQAAFGQTMVQEIFQDLKDKPRK